MRFKAFISYSSADRRVGEQFQRAIEHYRLPAPLHGRDYGFGPLPKRLTPLFRDRSDAIAGADLGETLRAALNDSEALVVLCSPASARSHWVNEEICAFKALGRQARIFPVLVEGAPRKHDQEMAPDGAFPPALYQCVDAGGRIISQDGPEPLAPDIRAGGDGLQFAKLKIVAALTGVPLMELTQRQHEAERRERRTAHVVTAGMSGLAVVASASAVLAWRSAEAARERLANAIEMAARRTDDAAQFGDSYGVPVEVVQRLLEGAERDLDELAGGAGGTPRLQLERARTTVSLSNLYGAIGDGARQRSLAREALAIVERIPTGRQLLRPSTWISAPPAEDEVARERLGALEQLGAALLYSDAGFDESLGVFERGAALAARTGNAVQEARFLSLQGEHLSLSGDLEGALKAYDAAIRTAGRNRDLASREELRAARAERAEMLMQLERHREALEEQQRVTGALEVASVGSTDTAVLRSLGHALTREGDMAYAVSGRWPQSIPLYERAIALLGRVRDSDPARIDYARDLSISLERLGDARLQMGGTGEARQAYDRVIALRREILARDPRRSEARRDVSVALEKLADLALTTSGAAQAVNLLQEAVELRQGDNDGADPTADPILARDLAVLWLKIGRAQARLGGSANWDAAFARSVALMDAIVETEHALISWRRDLAVIHAAYGDALAGSGRRGEGAGHWRAALRQVEQQLQVSRDDPRLQRDRRDLRARLGIS